MTTPTQNENAKAQESAALPEFKTATVQFEIAEWAVAFLKDYLAFLGSTDTVEDVATGVFFDAIAKLKDQLLEMPFQKEHDFYKKYPDICRLETLEEQKRLAEIERQNDP